MITALVEVLHAARRRAEANERWLSAVLSSIGDAVIATDGQGRVSFTNPVARSLTGWAEDEAKGKPLERRFRHRLGRGPPAGRAPGRPGDPRGCRGRPGQSHGPDRPRRDRATDRRQCRADQRPRGQDRRRGPGLPRCDRRATARTGAGMPARRRTGSPLGGRVGQPGQGPLPGGAQPRTANPPDSRPVRRIVAPRAGRSLLSTRASARSWKWSVGTSSSNRD